MTMDDLYDYALDSFGVPYEWGGEGPGNGGAYGFDCSGFVGRLLKRAGCYPGTARLNAEELYEFFSKSGTPHRSLGALAFFGTPGRVSHVGWMLDEKVMISAAGGGSHVTSVPSAKMVNASVKIQPVKWYAVPPLLGCFMPTYPFNYDARPGG